MTELSPIPAAHDTRIVFRDGHRPIAGRIWLPSLIRSLQGCPAVVLAVPGEDAARAAAAHRLAEGGNVVLAFDPALRAGKSRTRGLPTKGTVVAAAAFLASLPFVDPLRIEVLTGGQEAEPASGSRRPEPAHSLEMGAA